MLQAIIFDFDGIIADSEPLHFQAILAVARSLGVTFTYEQYLARYIGFDDRDVFRVICADHGLALSDGRLLELTWTKGREFERLAAAGVAPFPGVVELIEASASRMPVGLCSGATIQDIRIVLSGIAGGKLLRLFAAIVTADDVERSKPDPACYAMTAKKIGLPPEACLAIEDTAAGIASARGAGLRTLGVGHSHELSELVQADRTVPALKDVKLDQLLRWYA
jgi:beta-phosphoglucomutase